MRLEYITFLTTVRQTCKKIETASFDFKIVQSDYLSSNYYEINFFVTYHFSIFSKFSLGGPRDQKIELSKSSPNWLIFLYPEFFDMENSNLKAFFYFDCRKGSNRLGGPILKIGIK
jgi:hypothetical protein